MLKAIISQIKEILAENGVKNVYTAFDNIPISQKPSDIFTVVSVGALESRNPVFSQYSIYVPFTADAEISLIASKNSAMTELYDYFEKYILPLARKLASNKSVLKNIAVKYDSNMGRFVMKTIFSASGMVTMERSGL
ncbi:MAG: hypothetical protein E7497_05065 [Ruminococcus sp.]|nr:hypothetical protein [Ruminococcus sp.]